ncbi:MAG: hypothetical protein E7505_10650 [Ruminococcus sp.]|nr:hypothetical protein [Ruminococcus sp.]
MAEIENAVLLFNINKSNIDIYSFFKVIDEDVVITDNSCHFPNYKCTLFVLDEEKDVADSITCAVKTNTNCSFYAYGENELSFKLLELFLKNTKGDFIFLDDNEIVFERRNELVMAIDSYDGFQNCSFKNCYDLLKLEHINGFHEEYSLTMHFTDGICKLKTILFDLVKQSVLENSDVKLIDYDVIPNEFAVSSDFFSITVNESEDKKDEYYIYIHYSYSNELNDDRSKYLKNFFELLFEKFNFSEEKIDDGND